MCFEFFKGYAFMVMSRATARYRTFRNKKARLLGTGLVII